VKSNELSLLLAQLQSGIGYYYTLVFGLVTQHKLQKSTILPEFNLSITIRNDLHQLFNLNPTANNTKIIVLIHRLLIHLGDLHRYLDTLGQDNNQVLATKWYDAAVLLLPQDGMQYNQLGTLAMHNKCDLEAAFYYIRW
jgi:hypothetical protein